jgi:ATP-dependent Clp protease protease subunit
MKYLPIILDKSIKGERTFDIFSKLLKERIILLSGYIDDNLTALIIAQLLFLESEDSNNSITIYINSPGGIITSGFGIYDTIQYVSSVIKTICIGQACSMGSFILASGTKEHRYTLENSRIMIHQPIGGYSGQASDIAIHAQEIINIKKYHK